MENLADEAAAEPQRQGRPERSEALKLISCWTGLLRAETGRMRPWEVLPDEICSAMPNLINGAHSRFLDVYPLGVLSMDFWQRPKPKILLGISYTVGN